MSNTYSICNTKHDHHEGRGKHIKKTSINSVNGAKGSVAQELRVFSQNVFVEECFRGGHVI